MSVLGTIALCFIAYIAIGFATLWLFEAFELESLPGMDDEGYFDDFAKGMLILAWWLPLMVWPVVLLAKFLVCVYDRLMS